jgi:hypothetical protein
MKWAYEAFYWSACRRNVGTNFKIMYKQILVGDRRKLASVRPPARFSHSQWEEVFEREQGAREGVGNHSIDTCLSQQLEGWHRLTPSRGSVEHCDLTHASNVARFCYHFTPSNTIQKDRTENMWPCRFVWTATVQLYRYNLLMSLCLGI